MSFKLAVKVSSFLPRGKSIPQTALGRYLTITEGNQYREHVLARRLGSMFLLLGETICNSSVQVRYLPTDPPTNRLHAIKPVSLISDNEDDPYWKDAVEKYFARPNTDQFDGITYPEYHKNFRISTKITTSKNNEIYKDDLNNYVVRRNSPIIVRHRYLKLQDAELFFYQQLLLTVPCRSEEELLFIQRKMLKYSTQFYHR